MANKYGKPIKVNLPLTNPISTIVFGIDSMDIIDKGKSVGRVIYAMGGAVRVSVGNADYDLSIKDLWNAVVIKIGKPRMKITKVSVKKRE